MIVQKFFAKLRDAMAVLAENNQKFLSFPVRAVKKTLYPDFEVVTKMDTIPMVV